MKVEELVEWVAMEVAGHVHIDWDELSLDGKEHCWKLARKILSHPDLALIDREPMCWYCKKPIEIEVVCYCGFSTASCYHVILLSEALKEE